MGHWHEVKRNPGRWEFPPYSGRVRVRFEGEDARKAPFEAAFFRYEGDGEPPLWPWSMCKRNPEGWSILRPKTQLTAWSMEEAKQLSVPLVDQIASGEIDDQFEITPYVPTPRPVQIEVIQHDQCIAHATIAEHPGGPFEVFYSVYAPNGNYWPASTPSISAELDWEWGRTTMQDEEGRDQRTLADDLQSAREIARIELDSLVSNDPAIKRRA